MDPKDNTAQVLEINFDREDAGLFGQISESRNIIEPLLKGGCSEVIIKTEIEKIEDPVVREFHRVNYFGKLQEVSMFINQFSDPEVRRTFCKEVLLGEGNKRELFLYRNESISERDKFWDYSLNNFPEFFQKMRFFQLMKSHTERIEMPEDPFLREYLVLELSECDDGINRMKKELGDESKKISYTGFYYPNPVINRRNIDKSRLMRDLKNPERIFTLRELNDVEKAIRVTVGIDGDGLTFREFEVLKEILRRQS